MQRIAAKRLGMASLATAMLMLAISGCASPQQNPLFSGQQGAISAKKLPSQQAHAVSSLPLTAGEQQARLVSFQPSGSGSASYTPPRRSRRSSSCFT